MRYDYTNLEELSQDVLYWEARRVFEYMQSADFSGQDMNKLMLKNIMRNCEWWDNMSDQDKRTIGKLIAHNWHFFAQVCSAPINVVFVKSSSDSEGIYRFVKYVREQS